MSEEKAEKGRQPSVVLDAARIRIGHFINNKLVQFYMIVASLYAILGDDVRKAAFEKKDDGVFQILNILVIITFIIEIVITSIGIADYKFSLLFWLDIFATLSIMMDVDAVRQGIMGYEQ